VVRCGDALVPPHPGRLSPRSVLAGADARKGGCSGNGGRCRRWRPARHDRRACQDRPYHALWNRTIMPPPVNVTARVLVVEDDAEIARMLADLLADHGSARPGTPDRIRSGTPADIDNPACRQDLPCRRLGPGWKLLGGPRHADPQPVATVAPRRLLNTRFRWPVDERQGQVTATGLARISARSVSSQAAAIWHEVPTGRRRKARSSSTGISIWRWRTRFASRRRRGAAGIRWGPGPAAYWLISSISLGRQVWSIQRSNGPYIRRSGNQLLPGTV
jgi:hypothetical protein